MSGMSEDGRPYEFWSLANDTPDFMDSYTNAVLPVPSTIEPLDDILQGGFRPGVHFIGGNTGAGKTALALYMAERIASGTNPQTGEPYGVTFISLELTGWEVRARLGSRLSCSCDELQPYSWVNFEAMGRDVSKAMAAKTYEPWKDPVTMADNKLVELCPRLRIVDGVKQRDAATNLNLEIEIRETGGHSGQIVFIDYLQCVDVGNDQDEQERLAQTARDLNIWGMRSGVAVVALSAVSRSKGAEMSKGGTGDNPGASIFRGSSWVEYTGLSAFALIRRDNAESRDGVTEVELMPVKNRRGDTGQSIPLAYEGAYGQFRYPVTLDNGGVEWR